ncbi:hypothetical protein COT75_02200 [Candidatus Beckwithbacteria bacterium CG10_big_fil_rev_8_21_14_0_10_34_10]|uniref:BioF2-like acetyltransferase domain-containing protein n=1 Tax=Candidatus Beckwithbacteria bacterium CG10_big_fil_rev_8_21_14_0_10_34_10 TaxID=1974495 RepID=A0A2H0W9Q9_9BACT|nr:MAG: hypothetical protein COT75_02200 [Candidatus Beckwithbacteria bacterium CG10_big_fil_rev_8_21_14_0_10_34_10]
MKGLNDIRQTSNYGQFMEKMGWQIISLDKQNRLFIKKIPLTPFYLGKILRAKLPINIKKIKNLQKKYRIIILKIQIFSLTNPKELTDFVKPDLHPLIPTKTIWLDLKKTKKQLWKELEKRTRSNIRSAKKNKVKTKIILGKKINKNELKSFYNLWKKNKPYNFLFKPSFKEFKNLTLSFKNNCFFIFGINNSEIISVVLILFSENMAFDWWGANSKKGRKLLAKPYILWEAIKFSKKRNFQVFDFEGIYDKRFPKAQKNWQGFSKFKKGFGGIEIQLAKPIATTIFT